MKTRVMFATLTGNNEAVANIIISELEKAGISAKKEQIELVDARTISKENTDLLILVPYTFDLGSIPDETLDFYEDLDEVNLSPIVFGVAGSGDDFYGDDYCTAVDTFAERLQASGAIEGAQRVKVNLYPDATDEQALATFVQNLLTHVKGQD
ncbi:flavodoxin domain-containing protein [Weissella uvarum]|nr:flavodoxin domain-containing protein [Weissella uvarum]